MRVPTIAVTATAAIETITVAGHPLLAEGSAGSGSSIRLSGGSGSCAGMSSRDKGKHFTDVHPSLALRKSNLPRCPKARIFLHLTVGSTPVTASRPNCGVYISTRIELAGSRAVAEGHRRDLRQRKTFIGFGCTCVACLPAWLSHAFPRGLGRSERCAARDPTAAEATDFRLGSCHASEH
jgi:hypothetical protein